MVVERSPPIVASDLRRNVEVEDDPGSPAEEQDNLSDISIEKILDAAEREPPTILDLFKLMLEMKKEMREMNEKMDKKDKKDEEMKERMDRTDEKVNDLQRQIFSLNNVSIIQSQRSPTRESTLAHPNRSNSQQPPLSIFTTARSRSLPRDTTPATVPFSRETTSFNNRPGPSRE